MAARTEAEKEADRALARAYMKRKADGERKRATPSAPKPSDLGTGAAAKAAKGLVARKTRSEAAMDEAARILMGGQRSDEWQ